MYLLNITGVLVLIGKSVPNVSLLMVTLLLEPKNHPCYKDTKGF